MNVVCVYAFWGWILWMLLIYPTSSSNLSRAGFVFLLLFLCQLSLELLQVISLLFYSNAPRRDLLTALVIPFVPLYHIFPSAARVVAITDELFLRRSYEDSFVPSKIREATWWF